MTLRNSLRCAVVLLLLASGSAGLLAENAPAVGATPATVMPSVVTVPPAAQPSPTFTAEAATEAYLAEIPPAAKSRSDSYFEGGYWLILWDFLYGGVVLLLVLGLGWSSKMRDLAERMTPYKPLQTILYWIQFTLLTSIFGFPLTVYEGYFREHQYGLATQTFGPWMVDQLKFLGLNLLFGGLIVAALLGIVRRLPRTWWVWGALVSIAFFAFIGLIAPVYLIPIFNKVTRLNDPKVTTPILSMARANGIPVKDVFQIDASKQSTRMSANVSGLGSTMRITLNDNLLRRGSPEEIQAVMGHEMGHYVLNHVYKGVLEQGVIVVIWFAGLQWSLTWALKRWGQKWNIRGVGDTAVLPLVFMITATFFFILTPIDNTLTRTQEHEADMFGLNASRQPDGFAQAAIHLGEYRKMSPGPIEEFIFFDHPSGRNRIHDAMRWKAENQSLFSAPTATTPAVTAAAQTPPGH